ncbi:MAG: HAD family hydrolase, partial [Planctomycetota bacterium]
MLSAMVLSLTAIHGCTLPLIAQDPLPSWKEGAAKQSIFAFVSKVTEEGGADFVPAEERIATFDNDGTLWCEMPYYTQLEFAFDRVADLIDTQPDWKNEEPFKSALAKDLKGVLAGGEHALLELLLTTHANNTQAEFAGIVEAWMAKARHPRFDQPYTKMIYQPMLEVLEYLRANGFKTYIVSGGGIEFMRPWTEEVYGIPPEQVVGSSVKSVFEMREDGPVLLRKAELNFNDDK